MLVGGSEKSIALQPVSIEGTAGLNVAAGVEVREPAIARHVARHPKSQ